MRFEHARRVGQRGARVQRDRHAERLGDVLARGAKWLLPRIERFHAQCPETDVRLDTNLTPVDFIAHGIDVGVRYGRGSWAGLVAEKLMDEQVFPVASPGWLAKHGEVEARRGMQVNNSAAVLQAAIDGHGIALARSVMAADVAAAGRLTPLFPEIRYASALAYYVVYRADCATLPKLVTFREWLMREAARRE